MTRLVPVFALLSIPLLAGSTTIPSQDGLTVYDSANNITWLADMNLAASNRFGVPVCLPGSGGSASQPCINPSGSMRYEAAAAWVAAMNAANYLGHNNWQLPVTPLVDSTCPFVGPNGGSFGWNCTGSAYGALFYNALSLVAPHTAVTIPNNTPGPINNIQPYLYWSSTSAGSSGENTFSFATGWVGANTTFNFMYVLPMIKGKLPGVPVTGSGLQVSSDKQTVYDPIADVTWLANANLAASNTMGLPRCDAPGSPKICVDPDGSMNLDSANQFITNMNSGAGYLAQRNWQLPPVDPNCGGFNCSSPANPMGELYYNQFGLARGTPAVSVPNISVGTFHNIQPYLYWSCQAATVQSACSSDVPSANFEWSFSFGSGFEGTDLLANNLYATAYFVGTRPSTPGPVVAEVANAEGDAPVIAPNTWVEIKGANLSRPDDSRIWLASDFIGGQMPTLLDGVTVTINGKAAFLWYISSTQVNVLTPPDAMSGPVSVILSNNGATAAAFTAQAQPLSPSFFLFDGAHVAAIHVTNPVTFVGPTNLYPGQSSPAKPGETIAIYANGFGPTSAPVISGAPAQSGSLATLPVVTIGTLPAKVNFAGLVAPGEFQFNVTIPLASPDGELPIVATYNGLNTQTGAVITIQH
jgi:uncharacterized protein (TIGR03437 family)